MNWLGQELKISKLEDWYRVKVQDIKNFGGSGLLQRYGSYYRVLCAVYPDYPWDQSRFGISTLDWTDINVQVK